jgi:hypothetical protein
LAVTDPLAVPHNVLVELVVTERGAAGWVMVIVKLPGQSFTSKMDTEYVPAGKLFTIAPFPIFGFQE